MKNFLPLLVFAILLCIGCTKEKSAQITETRQDIPRGVAVEPGPITVQESVIVIEEIPEDIAPFIGQYVYDSLTIIEQQNTNINTQEIENTVVQIGYNKEKKCLTLSSSNFRNSRNIDITKKTEDEPFYQSYGESAGYTKTEYYFQNGGITFVYEQARLYIEDETTSLVKYVVFFKKV